MTTNNFRNKICSTILIIATLICMCGFSDVPKSYWGYDEILKAYNLGIIKGYDASEYKGKFGPGDPTTKEQLATMLYRVLDKNGELETEEDLSSKYEEELKVCKVSAWAYKYVAYGFEYGIWTAEDFQETGLFGGGAKISRTMISKWLCNAAKLPYNPVRVIEYSDVAGLSSYYGYLDALYRYDIMHGSDSCFYPEKDTSRAEASAVCVRLINRETPVGSDIDSELITLYGNFSDFNTDNHTVVYTSESETKNIQLDPDATIILNGKVSSFEELSKLSNGKLTVSSIACDLNVIVAHNTVSSFAGKTALVTKYEKRSDYDLVYLLIDDILIPFCITENTSFYGGNMSVGSKLNIFCDGCELIEVKIL